MVGNEKLIITTVFHVQGRAAIEMWGEAIFHKKEKLHLNLI